MPDAYETKLTPEEEVKFQIWLKKNAIIADGPNKGKIDSGYDYDHRGAFKKYGDSFKEIWPDHGPDEFKKPNHPTFSNESIYAKSRPDLAGSWNDAVYIPPDLGARNNKIMPEIDPNYQALQQSIAQMQAPRSQQRELLNLIPETFAALSGDKQTQDLVQGIISRRERAQHLDFQNQLDLKKLQLDTALTKLKADLSLVENQRQEAESKANIRSTTALAIGREQENIAAPELHRARIETEKAQAGKAVFESQQEVLKLNEKLIRDSKLAELRESPIPAKRELANRIDLGVSAKDAFDHLDSPKDKFKVFEASDPNIGFIKEKLESSYTTPDEKKLLIYNYNERFKLFNDDKLQIIRPIMEDFLGATQFIKTQEQIFNPLESVSTKRADELRNATLDTLAPLIEDIIVVGGQQQISVLRKEFNLQLPKGYQFPTDADLVKRALQRKKEQEALQQMISNLGPPAPEESNIDKLLQQDETEQQRAVQATKTIKNKPEVYGNISKF